MKKKLLALFLCCALSFGLVTAALITPPLRTRSL